MNRSTKESEIKSEWSESQCKRNVQGELTFDPDIEK